jgi:hypothetical protein
MKKRNHKLRRHTHVAVADHPEVSLDLPAHVPGVHQGNLAGATHVHERTATEQADARRSTSIAPEDRRPIDKRMPKLPPA